ncbi:phenylalanine--tRNA ligase beta subunit [bacterium BMS3Abin05]|nr:phenylalanine--tRNA ligase beta subunit [bacterium BMS3Abin05]GBE27352.1 phenylalanine--tRNA ligase beta subunit [bacterium BMS3Bbin03]HDZ11816.1 phenylalanine--tRNA ligase subunit beta [Bacteroidota bacterium]
MKVSYNWLKEYVDFDFSPEELAHRLTMLGLEVESVTPLNHDYGKYTIAQRGGDLVAIGPSGEIATAGNLFNHEDAAPVPFPGTRVGKSAADYLPEADTIYDVSVTPNRPDCFGILGIAREISTVTGNRLRIPNPAVQESSEKTETYISVDVQDPEGCPRYSARVVKNITVGPSPYWMQYRLYSVGIRAISNVVDVTNYVLMEYGHPLHAFDFSLLIQNKIQVRRAKAGERFVTLDGKGHTLDPDILLICDGVRPVALAGIMGGLNSEVKETTKDILLECAYFDPMVIRKGAKKLEISSESSMRFERGVDPNGTIAAINRTAQLIQQTANGDVLQGIADVYPRKIEPVHIQLPKADIRRLLGVDIDSSETEFILTHLGLKLSQKEDRFEVDVPTFRPDLTRPVDLIEEIARVYGYDKIEEKKSSEIVLNDHVNTREKFVNLVRDILVGQGFKEILTNSMIPSNDDVLKEFPETDVRLTNPISEDMAVLRPTLLPGLLRIAQRNIFRQLPNFRLFEIGRIFRKTEKNGRPEESLYLGGILSGMARREHWFHKSRAVDFYDLKGFTEVIFDQLKFGNLNFSETEHWAFDNPSVQIESGGQIPGYLGKIKEALKERLDVPNDLFAFELNLDDIEVKMDWVRLYKPIPKFPTVRRDLALLVDITLPVGTLIQTIHKWGGKYLQSVDVFDVYTGKQVPPDKKSVAVRLEFVPEEHTFTEEEINQMQSVLLEKLHSEIGAELRQS